MLCNEKFGQDLIPSYKHGALIQIIYIETHY